MKPNATTNWPVIALASLFTLIPLAIIIFISMKHTDGNFSYPVDDTWIHLKMADNLAHHGIWGVNQRFESASSSILYTLVLALFLYLPVKAVFVPLLVNIIFGIVLIYAAQRWLSRQQLKASTQLWILAAMLLLTPLSVTIYSGMEHTFECLFSFLFLTSFGDFLADDEKNTKVSWPLCLWAILAVAARYECLFLVGMACLVLAFRRRLPAAIILGLASLVPVLIFGLISMSKGSYFFPNSLLVKSQASTAHLSNVIKSFINIIIDQSTQVPAGITLVATRKLLLLIPIFYLVFAPYFRKNTQMGDLLIVIAGSILAQIALADTGKFYRYEAWLILNVVAVCGVVIAKEGRSLWIGLAPLQKFLYLCVIVLLFVPLPLRSVAAFSKASTASVNIYQQQYQMARFLHQYYDSSVFAANDIGAIAYYTRSEVVDLWGLCTIEIARSKRKDYWNADFIDSFTRQRNTSIAVIYDSWIDKAIPKNWVKIGSWRIFNNVVTGDDIVYFYAVKPEEIIPLTSRLHEFESSLPKGVEVKYYPSAIAAR